MNSRIDSSRVWPVLAVGTIFLTFTIGMSAQVKTQTSTTSHAPSHEVSVARGEVVYVSGHDLIVENGRWHDPSFRSCARERSSDSERTGTRIHDLKPGMKFERTLTVVTTPQTITTVRLSAEKSGM